MPRSMQASPASRWSSFGSATIAPSGFDLVEHPPVHGEERRALRGCKHLCLLRHVRDRRQRGVRMRCNEPEMLATDPSRADQDDADRMHVRLLERPGDQAKAVIVIPPRAFWRSETSTAPTSSSSAVATSSRMRTVSASQNIPWSWKRER